MEAPFFFALGYSSFWPLQIKTIDAEVVVTSPPVSPSP